jgi:predicted nucleotide-binding protein (sugar kinase/HSP70/actin superfamily)
MKTPEELGEKIVVQGGTFYNEAVLRGVEIILGREVVRPDISGLMGAFGSALIALNLDLQKSEMMCLDDIDDFSVKHSLKRCDLCGNHCLMTISSFSNGKEFYSGNRCERGAGIVKKKNQAPNLYDYKYKRLFSYKPLKNAPRGVIGLPRVLNMYEDYPFWFTFFTELGYEVKLSSRSSKKIYEKGLESIPSESVCYPGKLVHGHLEDLLDMGIKKIFYPSIPYNVKEDPLANNHYNCPIVISYPETIWANLERLHDDDVTFYHPFLPIDDEKRMLKRLIEELKDENLDKKAIKHALKSAYGELNQFKLDIKLETEKALKYIEANDIKGIVLAGRPYHLDKEINHGIDELIHSYGFAILVEDGFRDMPIERPIRVVDQWVYHSRLYKAARFVAERNDLELIQLNSFGCGLDAVTTDQVQEILHQYNKLYTTIKIDEINNLGAARIRIRSLIAAINDRDKSGIQSKKVQEDFKRVAFTKEMKENHTILIPQMAPIHFQFLEVALKEAGYNAVLLPSVDTGAIDAGLKVVHNDACYPTIITVGQVVEALQSGKYDLDNVSIMMSQTGGGCRATNYIAFIRKALKDLNMPHIPVISFGVAGVESNPGFKLTVPLLKILADSVLMGDLLMRMLFKVRPYEIEKGSANALYDRWVLRFQDAIRNKKKLKDMIDEVVEDFDQFPIHETMIKPKVGIVGEILVKFHPTANNEIVEFLEAEGAEAVMPDLYDFLLYTQYNNIYRYESLSGSFKSMAISKTAIKVMEGFRKEMVQALKASKRFNPPLPIDHLADKARPHLSIGNQTGEGWFLTAEMIELIESGVDNIACLQPFGCLPNHITGKGMIKVLRQAYPKSNIVPVDYDPGASEVNQLNRIKLMLSTAFKKLEVSEQEEKIGENVN